MQDFSFTGYNSDMKGRARLLRKNLTAQEKHLWHDFLKFYKPKFYRQRIIDNYIVDFYCSSAKLVIEIDGCQHYTKYGMEYDEIRTDILERYELEIMRFRNFEIDNNFCDVCNEIDKKVKEKLG